MFLRRGENGRRPPTRLLTALPQSAHHRGLSDAGCLAVMGLSWGSTGSSGVRKHRGRGWWDCWCSQRPDECIQPPGKPALVCTQLCSLSFLWAVWWQCLSAHFLFTNTWRGENPKGIVKDLFKINKGDFLILKTGHIPLMLQIIETATVNRINLITL